MTAEIIVAASQATVALAALAVSLVVFMEQKRLNKLSTFQSYIERTNELLLSAIEDEKTLTAMRLAVYGDMQATDDELREFICGLLLLNILQQALVSRNHGAMETQRMQRVVDVIAAGLSKSSWGMLAISRQTYDPELVAMLKMSLGTSFPSPPRSPNSNCTERRIG